MGRTSSRGNIEAAAAGLGVRVNDNEAVLVGQRRVLSRARVARCGSLAVVHGDNDRCWGLRVLAHFDVHAELCRSGIEVVDLGYLAVPNRPKGNEARECRPELHVEC